MHFVNKDKIYLKICFIFGDVSSRRQWPFSAHNPNKSSFTSARLGMQRLTGFTINHALKRYG